ncbi:Aldo keto reductase [Pyrrhoderma noxium]|uniref:Aldo keto reductase n=1 Tax=Pyrrhoderma noxium TaxID=2282107 RepID=A0A286UD81_9AGAM|nr:Aldo keto reductase [Pyrrhoderma noxium]
MDDTLEAPTSSIQSKDNAEAGYDSQNSDDEDGAPDWTKFQALAKASSSSSNKPVIPKRGEKEFEPTRGGSVNENTKNLKGSNLQQYKLERARLAMFGAIDVERTASSKAISYAVWDSGTARARVLRGQGIHLNTMGYSAPFAPSKTQARELSDNTEVNTLEKKDIKKKAEKVTHLLPEEALYLVERGSMFCWGHIDDSHDPSRIDDNSHSTPMTVQQAYTEMIGRDGLTLERYQVYAYLKRLGYTVIRAKAPDPYYITNNSSPLSLSSSTTKNSILSRIYQLVVKTLRELLQPFRRRMDWWDPVNIRKPFNGLLSYSLLFSRLRFIPSGYKNKLLSSDVSQTTSPYEIFYYFYKPVTSFKKTDPPPADYAVAVVNGREIPMPTIHEFNTLFGQTPELPPLKPRKNPVAHQKGSSVKTASEAEKQSINPHTEMSLFSRIRNSALLLLYPRSAQAQGNRQGSRPQIWRPNPFQALKLGKKMVDHSMSGLWHKPPKFCTLLASLSYSLCILNTNITLRRDHNLFSEDDDDNLFTMPFGSVKLNDGNEVPAIAFGTGSTMKFQDVSQYVGQALETGFAHIDTAQYYGTEEFVGVALKEAGLARDDIYVTSKYSGVGTISEAIEQSLKKIGLSYLDLYLIHSPNSIRGSYEATWSEFEKIKDTGLAKSIGVSNFNLKQIQELNNIARLKPSVNQILLHPYNWEENKDLVEYCAKEGIAVEAYSSLASITRFPGGPVDAVLDAIGKRINATPAQVIFAWLRSKGVIIVTTSTKKSRLEEYLAVADLPQLTKEEIATIEQAGAKGPSHPLLQQRRHLRRLLSLVSVSTLPGLRLFPQFQEEKECIGSDIDLESQVSRHVHGNVSTPGPVQKVIIIIREKGGYVTVPNDEKEAKEKAKKSKKEMEEKALIRDASLRIRIRLYIGTTIALWLLAFWMFLRLADPHSGSCHIVNNTSQRA